MVYNIIARSFPSVKNSDNPVAGTRRLAMLGKRIDFSHQPRAYYAPGPAISLLDGVIAGDRIFHPTEWAEFHDGDLDAVIDFGKNTQIQSITLGIEPGQYRRLYPPQAIKILISDDRRQHWRTVSTMDEEQIEQSSPVLKLEFPAVKSRYLRVIAVNNRKVFSTRLEKTGPVSIFIDEIVVH